ncbi:MAG: hypothetical protein ABR957_17745 [Terracidiphilus sp.]
MVRVQHPSETQTEVCAALLEYGVARWESGADRVRFDVLYLAAGDYARLRKLIDTAKRDPRDVMNQEYFWRAGHSYPHPWARRHEVNRDYPEAPKPDPAMIAVASVSLPMQKRTGVQGFVGRALYKITEKPRALILRPHLRALFLAFANRYELEEFAKRILTLSEGTKKLDMSSALEYRWDPEAPQTILRRLRGGKEETLRYEFGVVSWNGNREYWRMCSRRLMELAQSEIATHLSMMRDTADRQVLIGYRMPEWWARTPRRLGR